MIAVDGDVVGFCRGGEDETEEKEVGVEEGGRLVDRDGEIEGELAAR